MDFFVYGDGEDVIKEIVEVFRIHRVRTNRLKALMSTVTGLDYIMFIPDEKIIPRTNSPIVTESR